MPDRNHVPSAAYSAHLAPLVAGGMPGAGRRKKSEGKGGGHFYSAVQQGRAGSEELGEESPGWPIECLAVPRKLLPVSRGRFITPRHPAGKAVGTMHYSRFVTCYPCPPSGCPALVPPGPSGSTKKPARALLADCLKLERTLSDLINQAYALTPEEIALMWRTAPPRMPIPTPRFPGRESHGLSAERPPAKAELQRNPVAPATAPL